MSLDVMLNLFFYHETIVSQHQGGQAKYEMDQREEVHKIKVKVDSIKLVEQEMKTKEEWHQKLEIKMFEQKTKVEGPSQRTMKRKVE